jgi:8-oxo-dGTP pyrophosphatase MutT (NUDIX family)
VSATDPAERAVRPAAGLEDGLERLVRAQLETHVPRDAAEERSLRTTRRLLRWLPAPFDERSDPTHVTGSAIVLDGGGRVVLHRHKRLDRWLQPGGHLDPGEAPWDAALRETREETGLRCTHPATGPLLVHVDVHEGPRGHVHLDLRYRLEADAAEAFAPDAGESADVIWCEQARARRLTDPSLVAALAAASARA